MSSDSVCWSPAPSSQGDYGQFPYQGQGDFARTLSLNRSNSSAIDMRQLTRALSEAREGSGQVRDALLSASFRPRLPGLTKIVSKLSKEGSWRKALEVYEAVNELGLRPDTALTNSAISACDKGGRWQKALEIFDRMEPLGLRRDAITYSATISALAKGKQWHAALQIFDHMQMHGVEADVVTCCSLINALERGGQWQLAEKLFLQMCTVQEEQEQLAALVRAAPSFPPGLGFGDTNNIKNMNDNAAASAGCARGGGVSGAAASSLMRSHTSPSSVLIALRSGSDRGGSGMYGSLPPVNETGSLAATAAAASRSELDITLSLSAQQGILDALVEGAFEKQDQEGVGKQDDAPSAFAAAVNTTTSAVNRVQAEGNEGDALATAFARVTSLSTTSPTGSLDPGMDRALSATVGNSGGHGAGTQYSNPFVAASAAGGRESAATTPPPPPGLTRAGSAASALASTYSGYASGGVSISTRGSITGSEQGSFGMSAAAPPFVVGGGGGSSGFPGGGPARHPSLPPPPPPSRLQRGTFCREPPVNGPVQAAAAAHLRRAMSCFPDFDSCNEGGSLDGTGSTTSSTLTAMFNFSHAARVSPNRVCCNALLAAYARAKPPQWQRALRLLQAMWSGGPTLIPDVVSYNTALKACSNAFQLSKGIEIYHEMRQNGVYPNATSYNCLIAAASDASNKEVMQEVGNWLSTSPTEVRAACMNAYVTGLVKVGLWSEALNQFQNMLAPSAPARPTSATFCTIMAGHMTSGDYPAVQRTFEYMRASGVSPNIVGFNTLLAALAAMGNWVAALDVLNAALAAAVEGVHANTATFNTVLAALSKGAVAPGAAGQYPFLASQAVQVYQQMQSVRGGAAPDATTFNTLITILDATQNSTQVVAVYNLMSGTGLTPDGTTGHKVLAAAISTGQIAKAVQVAQSLQLQNIYIEPQQLSALLASCVSAGAWDLASQLCSAAHTAQGGAVASAMFNFVLRSALDGGQFSIAMEIINIMQPMGIEVDKNTANKILQGGNAVLGSSGGAASAGAAEYDTSAFSSGLTGNNYHIHHQQHATVVFKAENSNDITRNQMLPSATVSASAAALVVPRSSSTGKTTGVSTHFPITPQIASSPGANLSPESPYHFIQSNSTPLSGSSGGGCSSFRATTSTTPSLSSGLFGGVVDEHHLRRTSSNAEGYLNHDDHYTKATTVVENQRLSLGDTNAMLASLESTGDAAGCVEVFTNIELIGIMHDCESYHHVIATLVNAGDGAAAVKFCQEGHEAGVLKHLKLAATASSTTTAAAATGEKIVDLRGCGGEVAVTVAVLWMLELKNKYDDGDEHSGSNAAVKFIFGPFQEAENEQQEEREGKSRSAFATSDPIDWHAVRAEVQRLLTTGQSTSYPSLSLLAPETIASNAITFAVEESCAILEVQPRFST